MVRPWAAAAVCVWSLPPRAWLPVAALEEEVVVAVEAMVVMAAVVGAGQQFRQRIAGAGWGYSRQQAVALV